MMPSARRRDERQTRFEEKRRTQTAPTAQRFSSTSFMVHHVSTARKTHAVDNWGQFGFMRTTTSAPLSRRNTRNNEGLSESESRGRVAWIFGLVEKVFARFGARG